MKKQVILPKIKKFFKKMRFFFIFIFIFASGMIFTQTLSTYLIPASTQVAQLLSSPYFKLYFISLDKAQTQSQAVTQAKDFQEIGAGGYVWQKDNTFFIVASCYEKENDAVLVQNNIKLNFDLNSEVFCVDFDALTLNGEYDVQEKKVLTKALRAYYTAYQELFDIAVSLDTNVYNEISARLAINNSYANFNTTFADFKTIFIDEISTTLKEFFLCLQDGEQIFESLCSGKLICKQQTYSSLIKYKYTQLLERYFDFLQKNVK